jgi:1-deoxy-D-xylulose-5-phosphate synthase
VTVKGRLLKLKAPNSLSCPGNLTNVWELIKPSECSKHPLYQEVFGKTIVELARMNDKIVGITPAMPTGCSLNIMMQEMPDRVFDVGIAEQHAVTFSAGLASDGLLPFCNIYSTFMQRAYDQVVHDVALQGLKVVFCLDRGGLVGRRCDPLVSSIWLFMQHPGMIICTDG